MAAAAAKNRIRIDILWAVAAVVIVSALGWECGWAQQKPAPDEAAKSAAADYSGAYGFLREGEFVQITIEEAGKVTGFVSRYGDLDSDKGAFLDQFFKSGKLDGNKLTFTTEVVHGTSFAFTGTAARGTAKAAGDEGYYVLQGKLVETTTDRDGKAASKEREVTFKSFPRGGAPPAPERH